MGHSPLVVRDLSVAYQKKPVLFDVSFEVPEGKLISVFASNVHLDMDHVLYGEIAYVPWNTLEIAGVDVGPRAVWTTGMMFLINMLAVWGFFKQFKITSFDPALAASLGIPVVFFIIC